MQVHQRASGQAFERLLNAWQLRFKVGARTGDPHIPPLGQLPGQVLPGIHPCAGDGEDPHAGGFLLQGRRLTMRATSRAK